MKSLALNEIASLKTSCYDTNKAKMLLNGVNGKSDKNNK
jgi:hypothetical protein